ncbi:hypothetical protein HY346_00705 [Candidatus Microgenomates bacterium]|nr:hypothetical protein [Candidatus Microgenomates bacterium]
MRLTAQRGVVALITSIVVGLLLTVITTGAVAVMGAELRQSTDFDQSVKAYFAAEAGVEEALAKVRRDYAATGTIPTTTGCTPYVGTPTDLDGTANNEAAVTCQSVSLATNNLTGSLGAESTARIDLSGIGSNFNKLRLQWHQKGVDPAGWLDTDLPTNFPSGQVWQSNNWPAVMEVTVVAYPSSGTFISGSIRAKTHVLQPYSNGANSQNININISGVPSGPTLADCISPSDPSLPQGDYSCSIDLTGFNQGSTDNYVILLHARYAGANYKVEALNGSNGVLAMPASQLVIDVTGRAGSDVFRRVRLVAPITDEIPAGFGNFVLLADDAICKVLEVSGGQVAAGGETGQVGSCD